MNNRNSIFSFAVIVAALGYFVDLYDLVLFGVVKNSSLIDLGYSSDLLKKGVLLLNMQMGGMLAGGIIWGILGDTKGRLKVLFGSIFLYSLANIANGYVHDINTYAILRFIAGVGLAGELGAGVTLIAETMPIEKRGYGTMIVVVFGALGAVLATFIGGMFDWRTTYFVGGGLGLILLALRVGTYESGMYENIKTSEVKKGAFLSLFNDSKRFLKYIKCIAIGLPVWYTIGILIFQADVFAKVFGIQDKVVVGECIKYSYFGLSAGDIISGLLSQYLKSRKKTVLIFLSTSVLSIAWYLLSKNITANYLYFLSFVLGAATGYWAIFVTIAAEQFGTNLRATVTTTVPNFVRGSVVLLTLSFVALKDQLGVLNSAYIVGGVSILLALISVLSIHESFQKNLDYIEAV